MANSGWMLKLVNPNLQPEESEDTRDRRSDRELKQHYAKRIIHILCCQLFFMNVIMIFVGLGLFRFDSTILSIFVSGTLGEVFGIVFVITRHLFPRR